MERRTVDYDRRTCESTADTLSTVGQVGLETLMSDTTDANLSSGVARNQITVMAGGRWMTSNGTAAER